MGDAAPAGYRIAAAFVHLLRLTELREIPLQIHPVGIWLVATNSVPGRIQRFNSARFLMRSGAFCSFF